MNLYSIVQLLVLLSIANGTPVFAKWLMGTRWAYPLDGGAKLADGQRLFGPSKTLRGVALAIAATSALSPFIGLPWKAGAIIAAGAMAGDLLSSFVKRRLIWRPAVGPSVSIKFRNQYFRRSWRNHSFHSLGSISCLQRSFFSAVSWRRHGFYSRSRSEIGLIRTILFVGPLKPMKRYLRWAVEPDRYD